MFDKVLTPEDVGVGRQNRLVIPKQHAEKYLLFDASSTDNGLVISCEDHAGNMWLFYTYRDPISSHSYVMTNDWDRYVQTNSLKAGDTVSFWRGATDTTRDRLFIDWKRRAEGHDPDRLPLLPILHAAASHETDMQESQIGLLHPNVHWYP